MCFDEQPRNPRMVVIGKKIRVRERKSKDIKKKNWDWVENEYMSISLFLRASQLLYYTVDLNIISIITPIGGYVRVLLPRQEEK